MHTAAGIFVLDDIRASAGIALVGLPEWANQTFPMCHNFLQDNFAQCNPRTSHYLRGLQKLRWHHFCFVSFKFFINNLGWRFLVDTFFQNEVNSSGHYLRVNSCGHFWWIFVDIFWVNSSGHFLVVITNGWSANAGGAPAGFSKHCSVSGHGVRVRSPCYYQRTLFSVRVRLG